MNQFFKEKYCEDCCWNKICSATVLLEKSVVEKQIQMRAEEKLCEAGDTFNDFFVVYSGILKSYNLEASGKEVDVHFYFKGDVVGLEAVSKKKFNYSVVAIADTVVDKIPYDTLLSIICHQQELIDHLISLSSERINTTQCRNYESAEQKLANFLIFVLKKLNIKDNALVLPMKQIDIASHLSLTPETISRIYNRWKKEDIIEEVKGKKIVISNVKKLEEIAFK